MDERIPLSAELIAKLRALGGGEADQVLLDEVGLAIADECKNFEPMLSGYRQDERGTIDSCDIKVAHDGVELGPGLAGAVWLDFEESAHYGCRDLDNHYDHNVRIPFHVVLEEEVLVLAFTNEVHRDTVEEF
ncbi:MAG: hypothetical protein JSR82_10155 [Verrucomicrobia bacterium]|nr:hypothetical protein [Verrucomicrobiota bacterium]